jgi:hypothetical protein
MFESRLRTSQLVRANDEVLVGVERSTRADQVIDLMMVETEAVHEQDGVVLRGVEFSVRDVGQLEVQDHAAALEEKLTELRDLMRWLVRPVRERRETARQKPENRACERGRADLHLNPPVHSIRTLLRLDATTPYDPGRCLIHPRRKRLTGDIQIDGTGLTGQ